MPRLSDRVARTARATGRDYLIHDDAVPGFALRITPAGTKRWIVYYRANRRARRESLGAPRILTASEARGVARKLLARVALGEDPWAARLAETAAEQAPTVAERIEGAPSGETAGLLSAGQ